MRRLTTYPITDRLLISGATDGRVESLRAQGIDAVVCLLNAEDPLVANEYAENYHHVPLSDGKRVNQPGITYAVGLVVAHLALGRRVLVHCLQGRNRSGLIAGLALRKFHGLSGLDALTQVRLARPNALYNPAFAWLLENS